MASSVTLSSSYDLRFDKSFLDGTIVGAVAYGVHLTIYLQCCYHLFRDPQKSRRVYVFLAYITTNFILASFWFSSTFAIVQHAFIDNQNFPGGPAAYYLSTYTSPTTLSGNLANIIGNWSIDVLLVWRGYVIYRDSKWVWIMLLPLLIFFCSFVVSICLIVQIFHPNLLTGNLLLLYYILSLCVLISVTILISSRLLIHHRRMVIILGEYHEASNQYLSIVSMVVESALLSTLFGLPALVLCALKSPIWYGMTGVLTQIVYIAPLLIIYRVAQGHAWSSNTTVVPSRTQLSTATQVTTFTTTTSSSQASEMDECEMKQAS